LPEVILSSLVNDLSARGSQLAGGLVLVLDDYHEITTPAIHDALAFLLTHRPPSLHLVILGREDPPLPLSKLRVRGELVEIREGDLQFTVAEAAAFMRQTMGLTLSEAAIVSLAERTEGWVAALQIAGLSLQNRTDAEAFIAAFRGDDRYVMDYLMDEVFGRQPPEIQDFLLQTSILDRLSAALCDAVMGISEGLRPPAGAASANQRNSAARIPAFADSTFAHSQAILERLERANLFVVSLDNRREWYRYHHLFADLLRYRLQRTYPDRLPVLHRRACRWYADAGDPDEAMRHALAAPDMALAADLAEQYLLHMTGTSRIVTYLGWLQRIPDEIVRQRAYLCVGGGWAHVLINQAQVAQRYARAGEAALPAYQPVFSTPEGRAISREEVAGNLAAICSYVERLVGDLPGAIFHAQEALEKLPAEALAVRCAVTLNLGFLRLDAGEIELARTAFFEAFEAARRSRTNVYVANAALSQLGGIAAMRGKLREAESFFDRALHFGQDEAGLAEPIPSSGIVHGWLVWVHCQRNEIDAAQESLNHLLQAATQLGIPETTVRAYLYHARVDLYRGEMAQAEEWLARAEALMQGRAGQGLIGAEWIAFRGQCYLWQGDLKAAAGLLEAQGVKASDLDGPHAPGSESLRALAPRLVAYGFLARVLVAQGVSRRADALLEQVCLMAEAIPNLEVLLQALALRAVVAGSIHGAATRGLPYLERALSLAAPENFARPFLDAGGALAKPLRQAIMQGIQPAFAQKLLVELAEEERKRALHGHMPGVSGTPAKAPASGSMSRFIEPLTERERQALRLLAAGLTSTEVAKELVISVATARSYIKSLYGKLDAHSREEVIERGRQAGLL
jgi:LuxR family maltose regulon positive regulatory protein